jgi:ParB-like chromosome segregation protein Spo0J
MTHNIIATDQPGVSIVQSVVPTSFPVLDLDIQLVRPHPKNTQAHPPSQIQKLKASLNRFGQVKPVVVQYRSNGTLKGFYVLYAGHGVTMAIRELGWPTVKAILLPPTWNELECKGYLLSDNIRGAQELDDLILEALQEQEQAGVDLLTVGSSEEELAALALQMDTPDGSSGATVTPTMVPSSKAKKQIKPVLYADDLADFEAAIRKTGISNRGAALLAVCRFYLQSDQTNLDADWILPDTES